MALIRANWPKRWTVAAQIGGASESGAGLYRLQTTLESRLARGEAAPLELVPRCCMNSRRARNTHRKRPWIRWQQPEAEMLAGRPRGRIED
ncbi:hypothetical protein SNOG_11820 [Parastagonospora nodorum SN15]|nr:hypothetical protein SNOG_11820 [Parastagonospora nodorum SN15]EAT80864.1 hypothetical protein SNOG_11820 [Parastagonospora nodorum SN15]